MNGKTKLSRFLLRGLSYVLVATVSAAVALALWGSRPSKLVELEQIITNNFIGQADVEKAKDAAADAMVEALGDRWSYYISAQEYAAYLENKNNAYVGIGITILARGDRTGFDILEVAPGSSAQEGGILPGEILVEAEGESVLEMDADGVKNIIRGDAGTFVSVGVIRNGEKKTYTLERKNIQVAVATGELLSGNIGLIRIANFNKNCAKETIARVEELRQQGAEKLIFDVRNNPGGYVNEMLDVLDYLLPEGVLFRDLDYLGREDVEYSDKDCLELPMAVLVNGNSYSAAEFFAAALEEFDWATVVGEKTTGKGYYQNTIKLSDGSAVNLSTGKYFTPSGKNLSEVGGLTPDVVVQVDKETADLIYAQAVPAAEDPQIQAAVANLQKNADKNP